VEHLREVFTALRGAKVSVKAKKCHLFQKEVEYLGHIVGRGELKVQDKNIQGTRQEHPWTQGGVSPAVQEGPT